MREVGVVISRQPRPALLSGVNPHQAETSTSSKLQAVRGGVVGARHSGAELFLGWESAGLQHLPYWIALAAVFYHRNENRRQRYHQFSNVLFTRGCRRTI